MSTWARGGATRNSDPESISMSTRSNEIDEDTLLKAVVRNRLAVRLLAGYCYVGLSMLNLIDA